MRQACSKNLNLRKQDCYQFLNNSGNLETKKHSNNVLILSVCIRLCARRPYGRQPVVRNASNMYLELYVIFLSFAAHKTILSFLTATRRFINLVHGCFVYQVIRAMGERQNNKDMNIGLPC